MTRQTRNFVSALDDDDIYAVYFTLDDQWRSLRDLSRSSRIDLARCHSFLAALESVDLIESRCCPRRYRNPAAERLPV